MKEALAPAPGDDAAPVAALLHMERLRTLLEAHPRQWASRFGRVGIVAVGLLVACVGFYVSVLLPLDEAVDDASSRAKRLAVQVAQVASAGPGGAPTVREQMGQFYRMFPHQGQLTDTVAKIFEAAAAQGISLQKGEYRVVEEADGHLRRFQITLPIKADYPRIRRFLGGVAAQVPTAAIEHVQFERQKIADPQVEATIKLAVYLERKS